MKLQNRPLFFGALIAAVIVFLALFGPSLAPHDPMATNRSFVYAGVSYGGPPLRALPPLTSPEFPLGHDRISRDVLSRLLWAVRPTLLLCGMAAVLRMLIGVGVGLLIGAFGSRLAGLVDLLLSLSGAIPSLLLAMAVVLFRPNAAGLPLFLVALTALGWIPTAVLVQNRVRLIMRSPFIESAVAVGQRRWGIFTRHVMPQIWPLVPLLLASELSAVTLLIAELGYLGLYLGGAFIYADYVSDFGPPDFLIPQQSRPELGQMLSDFFGQLNRTPWEPIFAGVLVVLMLIGWTLLSEGLRRELDVTRPGLWRRWRARRSPPSR